MHSHPPPPTRPNRTYEWSMTVGLLVFSVVAVGARSITAGAVLFVGFVGTSIYLKRELSRSRAAEEAYIQSVLSDEPFNPIYEQGESLAVKVGISEHNKTVLSPSQAMDNLPLLTEFLNAKIANDRVAMIRVYRLLIEI